jgi:addiction module RelE/StbE family toxin
MWTVLESRSVLRRLRRCPKRILEEYEAWKKVIELSGPASIRLIPGYRDHALKGQWYGARSSSLDYQWRVIYLVDGDLVQIHVLEVTAHDYRKKS